ncbi:hypothetical protein [Ruminococcus flavefaciens]|uniref:Uncharacterized protein n=1 Tax=Ruminococcus flavefaciens 007c TaxID=1341157 RepID=W7UT14_RUMFL|nr:hypothetical protein [Ruminococcus flavefaciens]EWM54569.1 hypothetical protein RF007C_00390 [Ruminococcus flavefaciens 007c]
MIDFKKFFCASVAALTIVSTSAAANDTASGDPLCIRAYASEALDGERTATVYEHPVSGITVVFRVVYFRKYDEEAYGHTNSIYDALERLDYDGSFRNRRDNIAPFNGFTDYSGTAEENTKMLALLKSGSLIKRKTYIHAYYG